MLNEEKTQAELEEIERKRNETMSKYVMNEKFLKMNRFHKQQIEALQESINKLQTGHDAFCEGIKIDGRTIQEVSVICNQKMDQLELLKQEMKIELKRL